MMSSSQPDKQVSFSLDGRKILTSYISRDTERVVTLTSHICRSTFQQCDLTFSSLFLATIHIGDVASQWMWKYLEVSEVYLDVERLVGMSELHFNEVLASNREFSIGNEQILSCTEAAYEVITAAHTLRVAFFQQLSSEKSTLPYIAIEPKDIIAAYIYATPSNRSEKLTREGIDFLDWAESFQSFIEQVYPEEREYWRKIHSEQYGRLQSMSSRSKAVPKSSVLSDIWCERDALGYEAYAVALANFIVHESTSTPLTISIQAPWGGGKTSLMRMIRKILDPVDRKGNEAAKPPISISIPSRKWTFFTKAFRTLLGLKGQEQQQVSAAPGLKLRDVDNELGRWRTQGFQPLPVVSSIQERKSLTIWFNAWKYSSTNQVWAGLIDTIIQQIAERLDPFDREMFWLRLNARRIDVDKLRAALHAKLFTGLWKAAVLYLPILAVIILLVSIVSLTTSLASMEIITSGTALAVVTYGLKVYQKFKSTKNTILGEPAALSMSDYLTIPSYTQEAGFIHQAEQDLRNVLKCIPKDEDRITIFIDDLDRCSPKTVAEVVEAVNLFLAGDFEKCVFVLGMDSEMVAAALQAAHKDVLSFLPTDTSTPLGWRFMDKFVQLPFILPPPNPQDLDHYLDSIIDPEEEQKAISKGVEQPPSPDGEAAIEEVDPVQVQYREFHDNRIKRIREAIDSYSEESSDIQQLLEYGADHFRGNPREIKRFVNSFRLNYFLWWSAGTSIQSLNAQQLVRWTVLSVKWPQIARWIHRGDIASAQPESFDALNPGKKAEATSNKNRLSQLESFAYQSKDYSEWVTHVGSLEPSLTIWLKDLEIFRFFAKEAKETEGSRLSDGCGKGFW